MPRHKRQAPLFVSRRRYLKLRREHEELERHYRELAANHDQLLEPASPADPPARHTPSWAVTEEIPVITTAGLDPDKTDALLRRWGMAGSPAGSWRANRGTTG